MDLFLTHHAHRCRHIDQALLDPVGPYHDLFDARSRVGLILGTAYGLSFDSTRTQDQKRNPGNKR